MEKYKTVKDPETFSEIKFMGDLVTENFKGGELRRYDGQLYYLSYFKLPHKVVKDLDTWAKIKGMGDFETNFKNGELWWFNGELYYLSHLELSSSELKELNYFYRGVETM